MLGQSTPTIQSADKTTTNPGNLPDIEVTAGEMLRSTSTGAASTASLGSDFPPYLSNDLSAEFVNYPNVSNITHSLNTAAEFSSTAGHQNAWRFPYLPDIFNSCYHRWVSRRD